MNSSVKKAGKLMLAVAVGAAVSFGSTVAAYSRPAEPLSFCQGSQGGTCVNDCIADGFNLGRCSGDVCVCFY
ncbi:hypothetical protein D7Y13_07260 [Corallococcus praedator]|uniref:Uncharacterized protein n=1 Tax=Corallococcus praedator TaxID=2316724 RepID=A0ABX9QMJ0_9BACT|nr:MULTISPECIES: hypothetical protein [Corallococcus]RKH19740.1 hypothetical protein D7X74_05915 [Corallococcus sp. CA047B]RKH32891.1 hypothetical protein D7X75_14055 [Corallococcus sp. CA031C]RKI13685.1 hypothetical protein D7Y13_07260 [Corallococcus praedator]